MSIINENRNGLMFTVCVNAIIIVGLGGILYKTIIAPSSPSDFEVYYYSAQNAIRGDPFLGLASESSLQSKRPYNYFPISVVVFYPLSLLPYGLAYFCLVMTQILSALGIAYIGTIILNNRDIHPSPVNIILIFVILVLSMVGAMNIRIGQINHTIILLILTGYWLCISERSAAAAGVCFAVPALFKIWPAIAGIWLISQREFRALKTAIFTGVTGILLSLFLFGIEKHVVYFNWLFNVRSRSAEFAGGISPDRGLFTIRRAIAELFPGLDPASGALLAVSLVSPVVLYCLMNTEDEPIRGFGAVIAGFLLIFPSIQHYFIYPLAVAAIYLCMNPNSEMRSLLGMSMLLMSWTATPDNISRMVRLLPSEAFASFISRIVYSVFSYMQPATLGTVIFILILAFGNNNTFKNIIQTS